MTEPLKTFTPGSNWSSDVPIVKSTEIARLAGMQSLWAYNCMDCCITHEVQGVLEKQSDETTKLIHDFEMGMSAPALEMMLRGILVDEEQRQQFILEFSGKASRLERVLNRLAEAVWGTGLNPNSPKQLQAFFYGHMELPPVILSFKGERRVSTNREALEKLKAYFYALPFVNLILAYRDMVKKLSVLRKGIDEDGRLRTSYNVAGTVSGRWSSSENAFGTGDNVQNQTESLRKMYIADPGMKMAYVDLEQAESRAVALLSGDEAYWRACHDGDLHTTTAKLVWKKRSWTGDPKADRKLAEEKFYRDFSYRDMSKRGSHATNYYGQPFTVARHLKVATEIMESFQRDYFQAFPGIPAWHQKVAQQLQLEGVLITPLGRRRFFFGRRWDDATLREAIAYGPQSLVGDTLNLGLWRVWKRLGVGAFNPLAKVEVLAQVHDAILVQYPEELERDTVPAVLRLMEVQINYRGHILVIPAEAAVGWNWGKWIGEADKEGRAPNLNGLKKWTGGDDRKRLVTPKKNILDRIIC